MNVTLQSMEKITITFSIVKQGYPIETDLASLTIVI